MVAASVETRGEVVMRKTQLLVICIFSLGEPLSQAFCRCVCWNSTTTWYMYFGSTSEEVYWRERRFGNCENCVGFEAARENNGKAAFTTETEVLVQ